MWIEYCAKTGKSASHCVANMIDRDVGSVINKAASMNIPFHAKAGAKIGHPPGPTAFNAERSAAARAKRTAPYLPTSSFFDSETGRKASMKRWQE